MATTPDWLRLQKALSVEAERGFNDLEGKHQRFSEFLSSTLRQVPESLPNLDQERWQALGQEYLTYSEKTFAQRQHLVAETRRFLFQVRRSLEQPDTAPLQRNPTPTSSRVEVTARVAPVTTAAAPRLALDQALTYLPGIGPKNAEKLAKLGLYTVRDLLYYYPRDHIDYARQVDIRNLTEGETVTLIATVKRCSCFTSPRNSKLAILDLLVRDRTGQLKLIRCYRGGCSAAILLIAIAASTWRLFGTLRSHE